MVSPSADPLSPQNALRNPTIPKKCTVEPHDDDEQQETSGQDVEGGLDVGPLCPGPGAPVTQSPGEEKLRRGSLWDPRRPEVQ